MAGSTATDVMSLLQTDFSLWPFSVSSDHGATEFQMGRDYDFGFAGISNPIRVTSITATSMSFVSLPGHSEGVGNSITFSTRKDRSGDIWLDISASGPNTWRDWRLFKWFGQGIVPGLLWEDLAYSVAMRLVDGASGSGARGFR